MAASLDEGVQFWSLPPQHLKALSDQGSVKAYAKNTIIISEGERSESLFIILSGKVKVFLADEDRQGSAAKHAGTRRVFRRNDPG